MKPESVKEGLPGQESGHVLVWLSKDCVWVDAYIANWSDGTPSWVFSNPDNDGEESQITHWCEYPGDPSP